MLDTKNIYENNMLLFKSEGIFFKCNKNGSTGYLFKNEKYSCSIDEWSYLSMTNKYTGVSVWINISTFLLLKLPC